MKLIINRDKNLTCPAADTGVTKAASITHSETNSPSISETLKHKTVMFTWLQKNPIH